MKALIHLVPRSVPASAVEQARFEAALRETAEDLRGRGRSSGLSVHLMLRLSKDLFGPRTPYRAALEICGAPDRKASDRAFDDALWTGLGARLADVARTDLSTLLVGEDVTFIASQRAPVRYQYLMRRKAGYSHDAYLARYREIHSRFGLVTPGILGYVQFHVDPEASRRAAALAGLGVWDVDSVSELHLESAEIFLGAIAHSPVGAEAIADEEIFVDRAASFDFCSTVEWSLPRGGEATAMEIERV